MSAEILLGLGAVVGGAWWLMASGSREPPPMPSLGDYQRTITLAPTRAIQRNGRAPLMPEHDGRKGN